MEIGEIIAVAVPHAPGNAECPFCPAPQDENFVTFPGNAALGTTLGEIMKDPTQLAQKQSSARPKNGQTDRQQPSSPKPVPNPPLPHPTFGPYSYEAHHLIPGQQKLLKKDGNRKVMDGHPIEKWIRAGDKIKKDTGYSINNSDNGAWLASPPEAVKKLRDRDPARPWERENHPDPHPGALTDAEKEEIAFYAMDHGSGQFHYGKHALKEVGAHSSYPREVYNRLTALHDHIAGWANECPLCGDKPTKPPYDPTWKVNEKLDLVSMWIEIEIRLMPPSDWEYFISSFAEKRHLTQCTHILSL